MKQCNICGEEKELSEFERVGPETTYKARCKKCVALLAYAARKADPAKMERQKEVEKKWLENNKEHRKEYEREAWHKRKK